MYSIILFYFSLFLCFFSGYGCSTDGHTTFINAAACNRQLQPVNPPVVFDLPVREGFSKQDPPTKPWPETEFSIWEEENSSGDSDNEDEFSMAREEFVFDKDTEVGISSSSSKQVDYDNNDDKMDCDKDITWCDAENESMDKQGSAIEQEKAKQEAEASKQEPAIEQATEQDQQARVVVHPLTDDPTLVWDMMEEDQICDDVEPMDLRTPIYPDKVGSPLFILNCNDL